MSNTPDSGFFNVPARGLFTYSDTLCGWRPELTPLILQWLERFETTSLFDRFEGFGCTSRGDFTVHLGERVFSPPLVSASTVACECGCDCACACDRDERCEECEGCECGACHDEE